LASPANPGTQRFVNTPTSCGFGDRVDRNIDPMKRLLFLALADGSLLIDSQRQCALRQQGRAAPGHDNSARQ